MTDRAVLVVGASSGIGLAAALEFSSRGDRLTLVSRSEEALAAARERCLAAGAPAVITVAADVLRPDEMQRAVDEAVSAHGHLDVIVHTAAVMGYGRLEDLPPDVFRTIVDTAVMGTLHLARAALPVLRRQEHGTMIFVNSLLGSVTVPGMGAYATSKWGQRAVIRTLQQELRSVRGVEVCMVSPGSINTPIYYLAANYLGRPARPPVPVLQPERAGRVIAGLAQRPRAHVSVPVGPVNPLIIFGYRFLPYLYDLMVSPLFRIGALARGRRDAGEGTVFRPDPAKERLRGRWPEPR